MRNIIKTGEYKKIFAYLIMFSGVMIFIAQPLLFKPYWFIKLIVGMITFLFGGHYWYVLDYRLEKYGRC